MFFKMKISYLIIMLVPFFLSSCSGTSEEELQKEGISEDRTGLLLLNGGALKINNREIYLRGDMNDFGVNETHRLRRFGDQNEARWCTEAVLRSDWPPYKFKFADENWTSGTSFGYAEQPGILRYPGDRVLLNPSSNFEELRFEATEDGIYRFCLLNEDKKYYAEVEKVPAEDQKTLNDMAQGTTEKTEKTEK